MSSAFCPVVDLFNNFYMSKIYHQSMTGGRKSNVVVHYGIFSSMLKNHRLCTGWLTWLSAHHATRLWRVVFDKKEFYYEYRLIRAIYGTIFDETFL